MAANKKIKNATETAFDGIKFRSKLEARTAQLLKESNISFSYEPFRIECIPKFRYLNLLCRAVHYTPDFVVDNKYILEVKGFPNNLWPLKKKIILRKLMEDNEYIFYEIKSITQLKEWIKKYEEKSL